MNKLSKIFPLLLVAFSFAGYGQDCITINDKNRYILTDNESDSISSIVESTEAIIAEREIISSGYSNETKVAIEPTEFDYKTTKYWGRYTALRTTGWACFGTGIGFIICGYGLLLSTFSGTSDSWANVAGPMGVIMLFSSPVLVFASIPILSIAYYNKHKAKNLKLNIGMSHISVRALPQNKFSTPALSLALNF